GGPYLRRGRDGSQRAAEGAPVIFPAINRTACRGAVDAQTLEAPPGATAQRAECVLGGETIQQLALLVVHDSRHLRSASRLRRTQLFTVPSGSFTARAISLCVRPSSYASMRQRRCGAAICSRQRNSNAPLASISLLSAGPCDCNCGSSVLTSLSA